MEFSYKRYENAIKRARGKFPESKAAPEQETTIRQKLPPVFRAQFPRLTSMVDCFQIFIERPPDDEAVMVSEMAEGLSTRENPVEEETIDERREIDFLQSEKRFLMTKISCLEQQVGHGMEW